MGIGVRSFLASRRFLYLRIADSLSFVLLLSPLFIYMIKKCT